MGNPKLEKSQSISLHHLLNKKLSPGLFLVVPMVVALFAFSSGFVALDLMEHFFLTENVPFEPLEQAKIHETMGIIKLEILFFTVLGVFSGLGIAYAISKPLKQITARARQIARGDFNAKLEVERLDELAPVGKDFNLMVSSINKYLIDGMSSRWFLLDKAGNILSMNSGAMSIFGKEAKDFIGKPMGDLLETLHTTENLNRLIYESLQHQKTLTEREIKVLTENGREIRLLLSTTILKDTGDHMMGMIASIKDLHHAQRITEQIRRRDKLVSLGQMAANLAHEIRNPLGTIKGLTQLLEEEFQEDSRGRGYTRTIIREVGRLNQVVSDLLHFTQPSIIEFNLCSINELMEQAWILTGFEMEKKTVRVVRNFASNLPPVQAEGRKLVQAFLNIMLNALQAVGDTGEIRMSTEYQPADAASSSGQMIVVNIMNDGPPIEPNMQSRIFEPFVTTKTAGIGLGLAITRQIIILHSGEISVFREGDFTVFRVELPVENQVAESVTTTYPSQTSLDGS
ncbi:MAG: ATP-binding protein [Nitrospinales bacterium]